MGNFVANKIKFHHITQLLQWRIVHNKYSHLHWIQRISFFAIDFFTSTLSITVEVPEMCKYFFHMHKIFVSLHKWRTCFCCYCILILILWNSRYPLFLIQISHRLIQIYIEIAFFVKVLTNIRFYGIM